MEQCQTPVKQSITTIIQTPVIERRTRPKELTEAEGVGELAM